MATENKENINQPTLLAQHGPKLLEQGYQVVPIRPGDKYPRLKGWPTVVASETDIGKWINDGFTGVGVPAKHTPAVDGDIHDPRVAQMVADYVFEKIGPTARRVGAAPKFLLPYRTDTPFKKMKSAKYRSPDGKEHQVEILGDGQMFAAYHIHPGTRKPYTYDTGELELDMVPAKNLPILTPELAQEVIDYFEANVPDDWEVVHSGTKQSNVIECDFGASNLPDILPPHIVKLGPVDNSNLGREDDIYSYADYLLSIWNKLNANDKDHELEKITDILPFEFHTGAKWLTAAGAYWRSGAPSAERIFIKLSRRSSKKKYQELEDWQLEETFKSMGAASYTGKPATMRSILLAAYDAGYTLPGDNIIVSGKVSPSAYIGKEANPQPNMEGPNYDWPSPTPLPDEMPAVPKLKPKLMPPSIRGYAYDISNRTQSPLEFTAVSTIAMLGSLIGTQLAVRPKSKDNWTVVPNLWAVIVGEPSTYKSPAMSGSTKPLKRLEHEAREQHKSELIKWQVQDSVNKAQNKANEKQMTALMVKLTKETNSSKQQALQAQIDGLANAMVPQGDAPLARRYIVNDATVEKLGELLNQNPSGLMVERDELSGLLRVFEDERKSDRGFYLEAWNGTGSHTYDRIGRGTIPIEHACVSIVGGIQPDLLRRHLSHSRDADGMVQRFQLAVWPDKSTDWKLVDKYPDKQVMDAMYTLCERLADLDTDVLGEQDDYDRIPYVRFSDEAQKVFDDWYTKLMLRTRNMTDNLPMSAHLGKYPSLIASLALVFYLAEEVPADYAVSKTWVSNGIGVDSLNCAIAWGDFLEQHAYRVHAQRINPALMSAYALLKKIKSGAVKSPFKLRDVYRKGWSDLTDKEVVLAAVMVLQEFDYIHTLKTRVGGRNVYQNYVNPKVR